jgi:hypothetical protein
MAVCPEQTRDERSTWEDEDTPQEVQEVSGDAGGSAP